MKKLGCLLLLLLSNFIIAQIKYEKGYFIDNSGKKTECLIKNEDWVNNPETFKYKLSETDEQKSNNISEVKEFCIYDFSKYVRNESKIDNSDDNIQKLKTNRNPEWITKKVFLRLIVDGKYKLYDYAYDFQRRYFYSVENSNIEPLVFKEYLDEDKITVKQNKMYQQQLLNNITCDKIDQKRISKLSYKLIDLEKYFIEANNCGLDPQKSTQKNNNKTQSYFNLKIKGGVALRKLTGHYYSQLHGIGEFDYENKIGFRSALEIEYFLPFKKNKFSIFLEPSYVTKYKSEKRITVEFAPQYFREYYSEIEYDALDLTMGPRYYVSINENVKIFFNLNLVITYGFNEGQLSFTNSIGLGSQYKKLSIDLGLHPLDNNRDYRNFYMNIGYAIFDTKNKIKK